MAIRARFGSVGSDVWYTANVILPGTSRRLDEGCARSFILFAIPRFFIARGPAFFRKEIRAELGFHSPKLALTVPTSGMRTGDYETAKMSERSMMETRI